MAKQLTLNEGAQKRFVGNPHRASGYIGGLGSGKTFAGIARGLLRAQAPQAPGSRWGPRGCIAAINYPVLRDVVLPQFFELMEGTDLWKKNEEVSWVKSEMKAHLKSGCGCKDRATCPHVVEILFRSLDRPNWMRGMELAWFFIDEGRHVTREAWDILYGRLRQKGYQHAGWVCSTPNGYDWMWDVFHPDSPRVLEDAEWYGAPTYENVHLPAEYVKALETSYSGRFFEQEVLGHFVGMTEGAVFFEWDSRAFAAGEVDFDPSLPLYSEWDFGMGDLNVVLFVQTRQETKFASDGSKLKVLEKRYIGAMEGAERTSGEWAKRFHEYCDKNFNGRRPSRNFGDPAGKQRNQVTGTSVIDDLRSKGVVITPAPKRPADYAVRIMNSMMADGRVLVDRTRCERLAQAFSSARWPRDASGNRTGNSPVHDWTSHYCDAARYGTTCLVGFFPQREEVEQETGFAPNQYGYVFQQLLEEPEDWLGPQPEAVIEWEPGIIRPREVSSG